MTLSMRELNAIAETYGQDVDIACCYCDMSCLFGLWCIAKVARCCGLGLSSLYESESLPHCTIERRVVTYEHLLKAKRIEVYGITVLIDERVIKSKEQYDSSAWGKTSI